MTGERGVRTVALDGLRRSSAHRHYSAADRNKIVQVEMGDEEVWVDAAEHDDPNLRIEGERAAQIKQLLDHLDIQQVDRRIAEIHPEDLPVKVASPAAKPFENRQWIPDARAGVRRTCPRDTAEMARTSTRRHSARG